MDDVASGRDEHGHDPRREDVDLFCRVCLFPALDDERVSDAEDQDLSAGFRVLVGKAFREDPGGVIAQIGPLLEAYSRGDRPTATEQRREEYRRRLEEGAASLKPTERKRLADLGILKRILEAMSFRGPEPDEVNAGIRLYTKWRGLQLEPWIRAQGFALDTSSGTAVPEDGPLLPESGSADSGTSVEKAPVVSSSTPVPRPALAAPRPRQRVASAPAIRQVVLTDHEVLDAVQRVGTARQRPAAAGSGGVLDRVCDHFRSAGHARWLFSDLQTRRDDREGQLQALVVPGDYPLRSIWFVGDIHGDLLSLEAALSHIETEAEAAGPTSIVFLGDLIDDNGAESLGVCLRVLDLIATRPGEVCLLAGNHDQALGHDGTHFGSLVDPSDFADWLNQRPDDATANAIGKLFIEVIGTVPRALFLPGGLLVAHGGVPLADLHASLRGLRDLDSEACLQDFIWTRAHPRAPRKIPNRSSRGCQFGIQDFDAFCEVAGGLLGSPVVQMIRGHDHVEERVDSYPSYKTHRILTINNLGHRLVREYGGSYLRTPAVARYVPETGVLDVHRLVLPENVVRAIYPEVSE